MSLIKDADTNAKMENDIYLWISAPDRRLEGYVFNQGAQPDHVARLS